MSRNSFRSSGSQLLSVSKPHTGEEPRPLGLGPQSQEVGQSWLCTWTLTLLIRGTKVSCRNLQNAVQTPNEITADTNVFLSFQAMLLLGSHACIALSKCTIPAFSLFPRCLQGRAPHRHPAGKHTVYSNPLHVSD
ncbi:hypothetical protein PCH_Pc21g12580 [Penicillium rubens Wisconsin 54-1255]|uniref:Uncharacterized protein n=1 Tax=Penicillium rubens (strain ATCC 28089 / DSM 1075 / NRRL 1951 / Wisconsin 54-1255) TaxID=500485 RepID=B6HLP4_PENRW|nr:hypothetical protein PCH_Pc21g12580 [Penicillium rubens Wisconsin 54-1255]